MVKEQKDPSPADDENKSSDTDYDQRYILGTGASAGGYEALESFFRKLPPDTGMSFVMVQHLSPNFKSLMAERLSEHTSPPIHRVGDVWDWNIKTNEMFLSKRWKEMLGYEDPEIENVFDNFISLIHEDDIPRINEYVERYLKGEIEDYAIEFRMKHQDGSLHWILAKGEAQRDEKGIPCRMAGSHSDITERKQAKEALKESEQHSRTFFETMDDMIMIGNKQGKIFYSNPAVTKKLDNRNQDMRKFGGNMTPKTTQLPAMEDVILRDKDFSGGDEHRIDLIKAYCKITR